MEEQIYDVVVVGGGAAGLSAALVLGRARRRVVVVDAGAPRNAPAAHMQGFLSRDGMPPTELLAAGRTEVRRRKLVDAEVDRDGPPTPPPRPDRRSPGRCSRTGSPLGRRSRDRGSLIAVRPTRRPCRGG